MAMFYGVLRITLMPSFDLAYRSSGVLFHTHAILGALLLPLALVVTPRITGVRSAPLVMALVATLLGFSSEAVARIGFAVLQPVSVIEEAIAQDPDSPIAVANAIARKNGEQPGTVSLLPLIVSL